MYWILLREKFSVKSVKHNVQYCYSKTGVYIYPTSIIYPKLKGKESEAQIVLFRNWTQTANFISYDINHYAKCTSLNSE